MHNEIKTLLIDSNSNDSWHNLALEEYLTYNVGKDEAILYLWQNDRTVVIGKNQNPWKECRLKELEGDGGKLARRLTGGGAVYHDLGNLNFSFVMDKEIYNVEKQLGVIISALKKLGIDCEFSGRNDIVSDGKKFSGNAFYSTDFSSLHHGTLLINTDFSKLDKYLNVSIDKIKSKGIDSVKSRVVNLSQINESITVEQVSKVVKESFIDAYGGSGDIIDASLFEPKLKDVYNKYSSWQWIYGETPAFDMVLSNRFPWGGIDLCLNMENGYIKNTKVYTDSMDTMVFDKILDGLIGIMFDENSIKKALSNISVKDEEKNLVEDIMSWVVSKIA